MSKNFKSRSKPKFVLGIWMDAGVRSATMSVIGMAFDPLKLTVRYIASIERFLFAAKAITGLQTSDTFEIAVYELRNWLRALTPGQRVLLARSFDASLLEGMPPAPAYVPTPKTPKTPKNYGSVSLSAKSTKSAPSVKLKDEFYASWEWRKLRLQVIKEFGQACQCCGSAPGMKYADGKPVRICVDHIKPLSKFWNLRLERSNLQILCDECNMGKGNWDETDFRPVPAADEWLIEDDGIDPLLLAQLDGGRLQ